MPASFSAGRYRARMVSASLGKSEKKGTPEIRFRFIPAGRYGNDGIEPCDTNEERTIFRYITDGTIDYVISELAALGFNREDFGEIDSEHPSAFNWDGIEFEARCFFETYEGKDREKWEFARGAAKGKPIENNEVQQLNAKYGSYLKGRAAPVGAATSPGGDNTDIAF